MSQPRGAEDVRDARAGVMASNRWMDDASGIYTIWLREVVKFWRDKPRIIGATVQPALFLLVLGTGIGKGIPHAFNVEPSGREFAPGVPDYLTFIYPGIIASNRKVHRCLTCLYRICEP